MEGIKRNSWSQKWEGRKFFLNINQLSSFSSSSKVIQDFKDVMVIVITTQFLLV